MERSLGGLIESQLQRLAPAAGLGLRQTGRLRELASLVSNGALECPAQHPFTGLSRINADGLPFQWCLVAGRHTSPSVGFLTEPGPKDAPAWDRCVQLRRCLPLAFQLCEAAGLPELDRVASAELVPDRSAWPAHWRSAMWIGVAATAEHLRLKTYFNLTNGPPIERWRRVARVLLALQRPRSLERLCAWSGTVSRESWPVGIAIDSGSCGRPGAVRVYFRSGTVGAAWLARWHATCGYPAGYEAVRTLLESIAPPRQSDWPPGALVVSLEFPETDGPPAIKSEIEVTRWIEHEEHAVGAVRRMLHRLGLDEGWYLTALAALGTDRQHATSHRLVGIRIDAEGDLRATLYLSPPLTAGSVNRRRRRASLPAQERAIKWLRQAREGGAWRDFQLPVGASDRWVSAYVCCLLAPLARFLPAASDLVAEGRAWLRSARTPGGGWGFNHTTPDDADSTALAVLALGHACAGGPLSVLQACRRDDGGVATFARGSPPGGAWSESVADVTPAAIAAAASIGGGGARAALDWLLGRQRPDGLWDSYWWTTPLYPTWWVARVFRSMLPRESAARLLAGAVGYHPSGPFETALRVLTVSAMGRQEPVRDDIQHLLCTQRRDGSWPSGALLRLSDPRIPDPWRRVDSGPCFSDLRGIFTTVTAVAAIAWRRSRRDSLCHSKSFQGYP